ncbi:hypothetical protein TWF281_007563 [Arthrobotrys megalospora]
MAEDLMHLPQMHNSMLRGWERAAGRAEPIGRVRDERKQDGDGTWEMDCSVPVNMLAGEREKLQAFEGRPVWPWEMWVA